MHAALSGQSRMRSGQVTMTSGVVMHDITLGMRLSEFRAGLVRRSGRWLSAKWRSLAAKWWWHAA